MDLGLDHFRPVVSGIHLRIVISDVEGRQDVLLGSPLQIHRYRFVIIFILASVVIVRDSMERARQTTLRFHLIVSEILPTAARDARGRIVAWQG